MNEQEVAQDMTSWSGIDLALLNGTRNLYNLSTSVCQATFKNQSTAIRCDVAYIPPTQTNTHTHTVSNTPPPQNSPLKTRGAEREQSKVLKGGRQTLSPTGGSKQWWWIRGWDEAWEGGG